MQTKKLEKTLLEITKKVLQARGISNTPDLNTPLSESGLGLDSIGRLSLLVECEKKFNFEFPEERWGNQPFNTLADIIEFLQQNPPSLI